MTSKQMAYGNIEQGTPSSTHRLERGVPFFRRGVIVTAMPQFKGLYIFPNSPETVPAVFQQTVINTFKDTAGTRTRWPITPGSQVTKS